MSLLAPWFLAGFVALVPLVVLHLRRHRREVPVASLLLWRDLPGAAAPRRRSARVVLPLALALQVLTLVLAVLALTAPQTGGGPAPAGAAPFVVVVDTSTRMAAADQGRERLAVARSAIESRLDALPDDTPVSIVAAGATPRLLAAGVDPPAAADALQALTADAPRTDLAAGLSLAAGELHRPGGTIAAYYAGGNGPPARIQTDGVTLEKHLVGGRLDNQALTTPVARCQAGDCSVLVGVRNEADRAARVRLLVQRDGRQIGARTLDVAAGATSDAVIAATPASELTLRLARDDALRSDNQATVAVPDPDAPLRVALVSSDPTSPLARGLAALPGVTVDRVAPADRSAADDAGLVVLDRVAPSQADPDRPTLLVSPPALPGGRVGAPLSDPTSSGSIPAATLLDGVDLSGLVVQPGGLRRVVLPASLPAVAWAPDGPLVAAGDRTALLGVDPTRSNLAQLPAFPILLANVATWARGQTPAPAPAPAPRELTLRAADGGAPAPDAPTDLWPWLIAAALAVLLVETALAARIPAALGLRAGAGLLLVAALLWPHVGGAEREPTLLVIDRSASIDAAQAARQRAWIRSAVDHGVCGDPCRVVSFAGQAGFGPTTPQPEATDLAAALTLATGALPDGGRAIVLSDGFATAGDGGAAAAAATRAGVRVDGVALTGGEPRDAAVTRLVAGSPLHAGDALVLQATISSTVAARATLELTRDGATVGRQALDLRAGQTPLVLTPEPPAAGWHAYGLRVRLAGDTVAANDTLAATTRIGPAPRALVAGDAGAVARLLTADGMDVATTTAAALPTDPAALDGTDVVVLGDVPATALSDAQVAALRAAVQEGAGLLLLGGPHSLSLGRYAGTELDRLLPVQSLRPGGVRKRRLALELVIDRSSSMNDLAGGLDPKIAMARAAARSALTLTARDEDELGIVAFDAQPHDILPLQRVSAANAPAVGAQIDTLDAGGGTNVLRGLERGAQQLAASRAPTRHLVLISDGVSEPGDPAALLARLRRENISLSTIALGPDADVALLRRLARAGRGTFVAVPDARRLPRVLARETRRVAPAVAQRGSLAVSAGPPSPITSGLSGQELPPLAGNVLTRLREGASAPLTTRVNATVAPVLAQWQVGLGRVAVWTPGAGAWAATWPSDRPQLFTGAARWAERGVPTPALQPALDPADPARAVVDPLATAGTPLPLADVRGTLRTPRDATRALAFAEVAPSRYAASLGADVAPGVYGAGTAADGQQAQALLAVPYPAERSPRPADASVLGATAAATGGGLLDPADPGAALAADDGFALWRVLVGAALLAFLGGVALSTRRSR